ncbi:YkgJ family cysteine cluster protein [Neptuniibacter halophilus]|uniref:YkgJ family cysteine cluster protein n=1 Tax=Neptuniibacter halophilus TaxID=651666 RepID=UPI0025729F49|nr:YkgJ family cysteine cluster protein [Neptuniibacter halophilus]
MPDKQVFFSTADVADVASRLQQVTADYEALFENLGKQIYSTIESLDNPSDQLAVTWQYIEDARLAFTQHFPDNSKIACREGCSHCCSFPIQTPHQAIQDIATHLRNSLSDGSLKQLCDKLRDNIARRQPPLFRAPCPFLDQNQRCTIYAHRPLSCRWFSSPDAALCEQSVRSGQSIPQNPLQSRIFQAANAALLAQQKRQTGTDQQLEFIPALLAELETG